MANKKYQLQNIITKEYFEVDNIIQAARITGLSCSYLSTLIRLGISSKKGWIIKKDDINE